MPFSIIIPYFDKREASLSKKRRFDKNIYYEVMVKSLSGNESAHLLFPGMSRGLAWVNISCSSMLLVKIIEGCCCLPADLNIRFVDQMGLGRKQ